MTEVPQDIPATLQEPANKLPSTNSFSSWIDGFVLTRNKAIRIFGDEIGLPGIGTMRQKQPHEISLYSIQQVLEHVAAYDPSEEEIDTLADAVEICLSESIRVKGKIYDRLPPTVARSRQKYTKEVTYTVTQFARKYDIPISRANYVYNKLGLNALFTQEEADRLLGELGEIDRRNTAERSLPDGFASVFSETTGITERNFVNGVSGRTGLNKSSVQAIKQGKNPTPEDFGRILESFELTEDQIEKIIEPWLYYLREAITLEDIGREYGISRERVRQIANKLGCGGGEKWGWDSAEKVRAYRDKQIKDKAKGGTDSKKPVVKIKVAKTVKKTPLKKPEIVPDQLQREIKVDRPEIIKITKSKSSTPKRTRLVKPLPKVAIEQKVQIDPDSRPEYPDVLTSDYLSSLIEAERNGVAKLRGSSFSFPVKLTDESEIAVDYLIREKIFPQNASIRKRTGSEGSSYYYLDYHLRPIR